MDGATCRARIACDELGNDDLARNLSHMWKNSVAFKLICCEDFISSSGCCGGIDHSFA